MKKITAQELRIYFNVCEEMMMLQKEHGEGYKTIDRYGELEWQRNKIRYDAKGHDRFRKQVEHVLTLLTARLEEMNHDDDLYFNFVWDLISLEPERTEKLKKNKAFMQMREKIGLQEHIDERYNKFFEKLEKDFGARIEVEEGKAYGDMTIEEIEKKLLRLKRLYLD